MKKHLTLSLMLLPLWLMSQAPINDDCSGLFDLGVAPYCPDTVFFHNVNATESNIGTDNFPPCFNGGTPQRDVWFSFVASDTIFDYSITLTGMSDGTYAAITNPQIAVYRGDCQFDGLQLLDCASADQGEQYLQLDLYGLTPGITYYIRINDYSPTATPNWGAFKLCIDKVDPISTIDEGGSTACTGELYDSGGPDGDYQPNENYTFTICPNEPHSCINFTLEYYNIEENGEQLIFYDGPDNSAPVIGQIGGFGSAAGGGVCYSVQASSGCLTVEFISDGDVQFEGFHGYWECTAADCDPPDLISVDQNADEQTIIDNIATPQTIVTIDTIICEDGAIGTFDGTGSDLGLDKGLVMSTGQILDLPNPGIFFASNDNDFPGDPDLDTLSVQFGNGQESHDACIIELDVFVATDQLTFEYVFGSEEYPEFVNTSFNDIFAFLISGPGITGNPSIGNQLNIATLPDGTFVEINSVNNEQNWEYYRNNQEGQSVALDGLTSDYLGVKKSLTAQANVIPCNTYHLKLAIADRGDGIYDSGVFISEIKGGTPYLQVQFNSGIDYLVEECTTLPDELIIGLNSPQDDTTSFNLVIGGTATPGVDYLLDAPAQVVFPPGVTEVSFPITVLTDNLPEGVETLEISLTNDFGCGEVTFETLVVELHDELEVQIFAGQDTVFVCADSSITMQVEGAQNYFWTPISIFDDPTATNPVATPPQSMWVQVLGTLGICSDIDSAFLQVINPSVSIDLVGPQGICVGDTVLLIANNNVDDMNLQWTPANLVADPNGHLTLAFPTSPTTFTASVEVSGCVATDTITIDVDEFVFPQLFVEDTIICQNYSVDLGEDLDTALVTTSFEWTPQTGLSDPYASGPIATPEQTTLYVLTATSEHGYCSQQDSVLISVLPADVDILPETDSLFLCLGDSVNLVAEISTSLADFQWMPAVGLSSTTETSIVASPTTSNWYYATLQTANCYVVDSIFIKVDSLPQDMQITAMPDKPIYCEGEIVTLVSPVFEPGHFPDITHQWEPQNASFESPDSLYNLVLTAQDTTLLIRITENGGCTQRDSFHLIVLPTQTVEIAPTDTTICPGESITFSVLQPAQFDEITWEGPSLSCTDCPNPVASPAVSSDYTASIEFMGCPSQGQARIEVWPQPQLQLTTQTSICEGESVQLNLIADPNATYQWTASDGSLDTSEPTPVVSPTQQTTYFLSVSAFDCAALEFELTIDVIKDYELTVSEGGTICQGDAFTLSADVGDTPGTFLWSPGGASSPSLTVNPDVTTTYVLTFTDAAGCFPPKTDSVTVTVVPNFAIDSLVADPATDIFEGDEITLTVYTNPANLTDPLYEWYLDDELEQQTTVPSVTLIAPEVANQDPNNPDVEAHTFAVTIEDAWGCANTTSITLLINEIQVTIPNLFTPNGDQVNDYFNLVINGGNPEVVAFKIFNRWGKLVYDNDRPGTGWDGRIKGEPAPSDVYVYYVIYRIAGKEFVLKGDVTLLR